MSFTLQDRKLDQRRLRELANFFQPYEAAARRGSGSGGARAAHRGGTRITIRLPSRGRLVPGCIIVPSGICRPARAATWLPLASPTLRRRRSCPPATAWRLTWWLTAPPACNCPHLLAGGIDDDAESAGAPGASHAEEPNQVGAGFGRVVEPLFEAFG